MKKFLMFVLLLIRGGVFAAYDPFVDCAKVEMSIRVLDEKDAPVEGANVIVAYQIAPEKGEVDKGKTDSTGYFTTKGRCNSVVNIEIEKTGFYRAHIRESVTKSAIESVVASRRWVQTPLSINVILNRICEPVQLLMHSVDFKPYPATNEVLKLDLETLEWCPPYGNGKHDDLHLIFDGWRNPEEWLDFHEHLEVTMPNCLDGFYRQKLNAQSELHYAYRANTNAIYEKTLEFRHAVKPSGNTESKRLGKDEYLIFRVRTETNALGQVTHAHYGRISEKFSQYIGLSMRSWFNTTDNDPNLEDAKVAGMQKINEL